LIDEKRVRAVDSICGAELHVFRRERQDVSAKS